MISRRRFLQFACAASVPLGVDRALAAPGRSTGREGLGGIGGVGLGPGQRTGKPRGSEFVFARLRYDSGDWDYNPKVAANVLNSVVEYTSIRVFPEEVVIAASSDELLSFPFLFMTGHKLVRFSQKERDHLRSF